MLAVFDVIYFIQKPLTGRDVQRFGIKTMGSIHTRVHIFDLTRLIYPELVGSEPEATIEGLTHFDAWAALESRLQTLVGEAIALPLVTFTPKSARLFRIFKRRNVRYARFSINHIPQPARGLRWPSLSWAWTRALDFLNYYQRPSWVFLGGTAAPLGWPRPAADTKIVASHSLDYDLFLEKRETVVCGEYDVFLDECVPFHPDLAIEGRQIDAADYYKTLNDTLHRSEKLSGIDIVVAVHPRSNNDVVLKFTGGRRGFKGRTADLLYGATAVLAHSSTAIGLAILYDKPVIFLNWPNLSSSYMGPQIEAMREAVKRPDYIARFVKHPESPEKPFWEIVADEIGMDSGPR